MARRIKRVIVLSNTELAQTDVLLAQSSRVRVGCGKKAKKEKE
jgi:hypothetical protein